jgi:hypothetical protein
VEVSEELEDIIDRLLTGLKDRGTVIRWSCAKGIGRVAKLLAKVRSLPPPLLHHPVTFHLLFLTLLLPRLLSTPFLSP